MGARTAAPSSVWRALCTALLSPFPRAYQYITGRLLNGLMGGYGYDAFTPFLFGALIVVFAIQQYRTRLAKLKYK